MNSNLLEKMSHWETVIAVMGFDLEDIIDNAYNDDSQFMDTLIHYRTIEQRKADQEPVMQAVMRTADMGVTEEDIDEYYEHKMTIAAAEQGAKDLIAINTHPIIQKLHSEHGFSFTESPKKYANHRCFEFTTKDGITVQGRCFRPTWNCTRIWTQWKDRTGKVYKQKWEAPFSTYAPQNFPQPWAGHRATDQVLCYMMAYFMTTPRVKMPSPHLTKAKK